MKSDRAGSRRISRFVRGVRRFHMYLGLLLIPWVLLFGITALSFNHPTVGRGLESKALSAEEVRAASGVTPWQPGALAAEVMTSLGEDTGAYSLTPGSARFSGWPLFVSPSADGKEVLIFSMDSGRAVMTTRPAPPQSSLAPFSGREVLLPEYELSSLAAKLENLQSQQDLVTTGPLVPHPKIHPELQFQLEDSQGRSWNAVYDLSSQVLEGRPTDESYGAPVIELLESLHKQHHYPANFGPTFFWALMADLTAMTLVFWALSGLLMWWQMRKFRRVGVVFLVIAGALSGAVMLTTAERIQFGPEGGTAR